MYSCECVFVEFLCNTILPKKSRGTKKIVHNTQPDIITKQETHRNLKHKNTSLYHHTTIRTDGEHKQGGGGGLITLIQSDIPFTNIHISKTINTHSTELQLVKLHIGKTKHTTVANTYFPPRHTILHLGDRHGTLHTTRHQYINTQYSHVT